MRISLPSYAKVNLWLEIAGRRPDGFHELITVLQTVSLKDDLVFESADPGVKLVTRGRPVPDGEENSIVKAARLVLHGSGIGLRIALTKRIPLGAGLGGGSSNAAVTLMAANRLSGNRLTWTRLGELAASLGSDVSFFLRGGTALGTGRGERIESLEISSLPQAFLLVWPRFALSTGDVYASLGAPAADQPGALTSGRADTTIRRFREIAGENEWRRLRNDLEKPAIGLFPALARIKECLLQWGCSGVLLAGSGSVVFAMGDRPTLTRASRLCRERDLGETFLCRPVGGSEYRRRFERAGVQFESLGS
jgi:4-diphosphocytidyl-2-C-methyl-D-erythritol kinase